MYCTYQPAREHVKNTKSVIFSFDSLKIDNNFIIYSLHNTQQTFYWPTTKVTLVLQVNHAEKRFGNTKIFLFSVGACACLTS